MTDEQDYAATRALVAALRFALGIAEGEHIDNTGMECDVSRGRDDCCSKCAAAEQLRKALQEMGVRAIWRDGRTIEVSEAEIDDLYRIDRFRRQGDHKNAARLLHEMPTRYPETHTRTR